jgi:hypothetical protein
MKNKKEIETPSLQDEKQLFKKLESLRNADHGLQVPDGYFDSLSSRISDRINKKSPTAIGSLIITLKKKVVLIPITAIASVILALFILFPSGQKVPAIAGNELSEISLAYDASYAEEAYFSESCQIETELKELALSGTASNIVQPGEVTTTEIIEYLGNQEIDPEILSNYK